MATLIERAKALGISVSTLKRRLKEQNTKRTEELLQCGYILKDGKLVPDTEKQQQFLRELKRK